MRRILLLAALLALALPAAAGAHPLGNFSMNHLTEVSIAKDRVDVRYVLDQAEIPTFQQRGLSASEQLARVRAEVDRRLVLTVDGRRLHLRGTGAPALAHPPGQGGLRTTRVELSLSTRVTGAQRVLVHDGTYPGRVGWRAVVARPGAGTAVRSSVPSSDPTGGLRRYPADALASPSDVRDASFAVAAGAGTLQAPGARHVATAPRTEDGLARTFQDAADGRGVLLLLLLTAFAWGALHALSPGHGKTMVAAYLVGARGTPRHALALGATVTITHTAGVFALGVVALGLSELILPEDLYPWLNLASGLLVVTVGAGVLRARTRRARHAHHHHHHHHHAPPERLSWRGLIAMGASAGLIPCPSALVVLLGAVAQGQIVLGMVLIVAFSAGLAATLTGLGLAVVLAGRALAHMRVPGRLATAVPTISAALIVGVGIVLTAQALPQVA